MEENLQNLVKAYVINAVKFERIRTKKGFEKKYKLHATLYNINDIERLNNQLEIIIRNTFGLGKEHDDMVKKIINERVK